MPLFATSKSALLRARLRAGGVLLVGWTLLSAPLPAQEEEDLTAGLAAMEHHLGRGKELFNELKFQDAIGEFTAVVEAYEGGKVQDLGERVLQSVAQSLELRGRAYFNLGDRERARGDFARLLRVKIDYQLDDKAVSPKVIDLFNEVKKENVGTLSVITNPPGAEVTLNDDPIGKAPVLGRAVMQGTYKLLVRLKGYQDHQEDLILTPRKEEKREIPLVPNRRTLQFVTQPAGVSVFIDDQPAGTTFGSLPPEMQSQIKEQGLDPARTSAPLLVPYVEAKEHRVRFEKECYQPDTRTIAVTLDLERNTPQVFNPVALREDVGQVRISSHPSGADVLIDGKGQGTTPLQLAAVCAGERDIRLVKKDEGTWFERVRIRNGAVNLLDVTLRPTLLYLGTFHLDEWGRLAWTDEDKSLLEGMKSLQSVNRVREDDSLRAFRSDLEKALALPENADRLRKGAGLPPPRVLDALKTFEADLLLVGVIVQEPGSAPVSALLLYSREQAEPERIPVDLAQSEEVASFLARFDREPMLSRPWIGATFADSLLEEGPVVVRVIKGGPAAAAGLLPGDAVLSVNGQKVASARGLSTAAAQWKEGDSLSFGLRRGTEAQTLAVTVSSTPLLLPLDSPDFYYNKALADYRQVGRGDDHPIDRQIGMLNLGIALLHFKAYDRALAEAFNLVTLPAGTGISPGTVRYFQGLCYLRKDLVPEARAAFQDAAAAPDATLDSNDGPPVASRAKALLR